MHWSAVCSSTCFVGDHFLAPHPGVCWGCSSKSNIYNDATWPPMEMPGSPQDLHNSARSTPIMSNKKPSGFDFVPFEVSLLLTHTHTHTMFMHTYRVHMLTTCTHKHTHTFKQQIHTFSLYSWDMLLHFKWGFLDFHEYTQRRGSAHRKESWLEQAQSNTNLIHLMAFKQNLFTTLLSCQIYKPLCLCYSLSHLWAIIVTVWTPIYSWCKKQLIEKNIYIKWREHVLYIPLQETCRRSMHCNQLKIWSC